ncbi:hypothetical protein D9V96_019555 [Zobellia laminariae]|uniref:hypothetical protein n=1 Tax=Zobellia laminariae TaxID=248906 RepID=UPI0012D9F798|nr:hypothetical protein [Zobellia laminariae]
MKEIYQIELVKAGNLTAEENEIVSRYWLVKDGLFCEKPSEIAKNRPLSTLEVSKIAKKHGHLLITNKCSCCQTERKLKATSQALTKRYLISSWDCDDCAKEKKVAKKERLELIEIQLKEDRANKFQKAIAEKSWTKFSKEELHALLQMLQAPTAKHLIAGLIKLNDKSYWKILHKANIHGMVDLVKKDGFYITDYTYPTNITEMIQEYLESISLNNPPNEFSSPVHPEMGFRLVKNKNSRSAEDALYFNDVTFDRDILIKANTLYSYSVWPRENGDAWISITPSDNILKSKNITRPNGPQHVGDVIKKWKY